MQSNCLNTSSFVHSTNDTQDVNKMTIYSSCVGINIFAPGWKKSKY